MLPAILILGTLAGLYLLISSFDFGSKGPLR